jgi:hypothetical protein
MPHDMKNFSDALAIDTTRKLVVDLHLRKHGHTVSLVKLNGFVINVDRVTFELDLLDPILLEIDLLEFTEGCSGVEVESLTVNGYEVLPKFQHISSSHLVKSYQ